MVATTPASVEEKSRTSKLPETELQPRPFPVTLRPGVPASSLDAKRAAISYRPTVRGGCGASNMRLHEVSAEPESGLTENEADEFVAVAEKVPSVMSICP